MRLVENKCEKTLMVSNDRSLTNQKVGLSNSLNLTNQDFAFVWWMKKTENNSVLAGCTFSLPRSLRLSSLLFYGLPHRLVIALPVSQCVN